MHTSRLMRAILFVTFFGGGVQPLHAQNEAAQWSLANGFIDFRQNPPVYSPTIFPSFFEGNTAMCDKNANLLFYGNSSFLRNRLGQPMPEFRTPNGGLGNFLMGCEYPGFGSQTAITIPWPGRDSLYLLFYWSSGSVLSPYDASLRYAVINMNRDGGLGDVVVRDVQLLGGQKICNKLTAALHCNKKDFWIVGHYLNSDKYFSLLVNQSGISASPVLSAGNFVSAPLTNYTDNGAGGIKVSSSGDKIACGFRGDTQFVEYGSFNSSTGQVTNLNRLTAQPGWAQPIHYQGNYAVEFSASGNYLYLGEIYNVQWPCCVYATGHLWQYDLSSGVHTTIQNSKFLVDSTMNENYYGLQMAINGKIYLNKDRYSIDVVNNPEAPNAGCNIQRNVFFTNTLNGKDFPNFPGNYFRYPVLTANNCQFQNISFSIQNTVGVASVNWNFGDPASGAANTSTSFTPTHIFTQPGPYRVRLVVEPINGCANDTLYKIVHAGQLSVFLGNDTAVCTGDTLQLKLRTPVPLATYQWSTGATDSAIRITQGGTYWVKVFVGDCFAVDTVNVTVRSLPQFSLGNDTAICGNQPYTLQPQPGYAGAAYLWNTGDVSSTLTASTPGLYWLRLTDNYGCRYRDSTNISFRTLPTFNLGNDTSLCQGQNLPLRANITANSYLWNTGSTTQQIAATQTGYYWCDATLNGCTYRDSIFLLFKPLPIVNLGVDTTLCEGDTYQLSAANTPTSSYLWQNGNTSPVYTVSLPGTYSVTVNMNGCEKADTVVVQYNLKPRINLGPDLTYCPSMQLQLKPEILYAQTLLWQDGSVSPTFTATQPGLYHLTGTNYCGSKTDSLIILNGVCKVYVPSAFTPNGDGVNDIFKVQYGEGIIQFEMSIFNRWGQRVFFTTDKNLGWGGGNKGKIQPGTYIYQVRYKESSTNGEKLMKGVIMLIL